MLPLKKTNVNECTERSSSTSSTDYAVVMQNNVPHLYTDSKHRYSIHKEYYNGYGSLYILRPSAVSSDIIHLFTEN